MSVQDLRFDELSDTLKRDWCASFDVVSVDDNTWTLTTPFVMPDGDGFAILLEHSHNGWRLSDAGVTASRAFMESDVTAGSEARFTLAASLLGLEVNEWTLSTTLPRFPDALDVAYFLRAALACFIAPELQPVASREDQYTQRLRTAVIERLQPGVPNENNWYPPQDTKRLYRTDLRIAVPNQMPVLVFAVGTDDKASVTALSVGKYRDWNVTGRQFAAVKPSVTSKAVYRLQDSFEDGHVELIDPKHRLKITRAFRDLGVPMVPA